MWKTLTTCRDSIEASMWTAKLADHGIEAKILDDKITSIYPMLSNAIPVRVQVRDEDFIKAKRLVIDNGEDGNVISIEDLEAEAMQYPHPNEAHLEKCPACGSTKISFRVDTRTGWLGKLFSKRIRQCECGYEWK